MVDHVCNFIPEKENSAVFCQSVKVNCVSFVLHVGLNAEGKEVYLKDVWPSKEEVQDIEEHTVVASIFRELRSKMQVKYCCFLLCLWWFCLGFFLLEALGLEKWYCTFSTGHEPRRVQFYGLGTCLRNQNNLILKGVLGV